MGTEKVQMELAVLGISPEITEKILKLVALHGQPSAIFETLEAFNFTNENFVLGVQELTTVVKYLHELGVPASNYIIDMSIARGLDYYTGTVYETILNDLPQIGAICSGGRYDNLAESLSNHKLPGVGISIGLTRLFSQLLQHGRTTKPTVGTTSQILIVPLIKDLTTPLAIATELRTAGINTEIYLEDAKMKKKLDYANKLGINSVIFIGEDEIKANAVTVKNMETGTQNSVSREDLVPYFLRNSLIQSGSSA
jgi:histidyl-tRNA synthetase